MMQQYRLAAILSTMVLGGLLASPAAAVETLVGVHFSGLPSTHSGAAVIGGAGDVWNKLAPSRGTANLVTTTGASSGYSVTYSAFTNWFGRSGQYAFEGTAAQNLMQSYLVGSDSRPITATISGLTAGEAFKLYLYTQGDVETVGRNHIMTVNGATKTNVTTGIGTFSEGNNYAVFTGSADSLGTISIELRGGPNPNQPFQPEADLNGFQLLVGAADVAAVPEPTSWAMMIAGFGVVGAASRRRRVGTVRFA